MNARFLAALLALVLLWTGAWTHEVHAVRAVTSAISDMAKTPLSRISPVRIRISME